MTTQASPDLRVGFLAIGRKRPGFDPQWGDRMQSAAWQACEAMGFTAIQPDTRVLDAPSLRAALDEFRRAGCEALLVLQPTMGDGRLTPILAQLWDAPIVLWATPERPDSDRVSSCSLVAAHVFASILRQMGRPFELVYGPGDDGQTRREVADAVGVTAAAARLRRSKVGLVGYHAPGFVNMHADPLSIDRRLGVELQHFGLAELYALVDGCDAGQIDADVADALKLDIPLADNLSPQDLHVNSRYFLAMRELINGQGLDALAVRCWPELPDRYGHWPYLAMMRLTELGQVVALEGDVDGAILGLMGKLLGLGAGYISDWLEHDRRSITLWHPGHAPRSLCEPGTLRLGRHFNNDKPLVVNAWMAADRPITLARLWRCDDRYALAAFPARTAAPRRPLAGVAGTAVVEDRSVPDLFDRLLHAGMPHHVTVFQGHHVDDLRRLARLINLNWIDV